MPAPPDRNLHMPESAPQTPAQKCVQLRSPWNSSFLELVTIPAKVSLPEAYELKCSLSQWKLVERTECDHVGHADRRAGADCRPGSVRHSLLREGRSIVKARSRGQSAAIRPCGSWPPSDSSARARCWIYDSGNQNFSHRLLGGNTAFGSLAGARREKTRGNRRPDDAHRPHERAAHHQFPLRMPAHR